MPSRKMDEDLEHRLALLGRDVAFMGEKTHKVVTENYLVKLSGGHDIKKFSAKIARVLEGIVKNSVCYAKDLHGIVSTSNQKDDLTEVIKLLDTIVSLDDKIVKNGGKNHLSKDCGKDEQKKNTNKESDCYPEFQIKQESLHIVPTEVPNSFKAELPSDNEHIHEEENTEDYILSDELKNKTSSALNIGSDTFNASTVTAPSTFGTDASTVKAPSPFGTDASTVKAPSRTETNSAKNNDHDAFDSDAFSIENEPLTERIKKKLKKQKDIEQKVRNDKKNGKKNHDTKLKAKRKVFNSDTDSEAENNSKDSDLKAENIKENSKRNKEHLKNNKNDTDSDLDVEDHIKSKNKEKDSDNDFENNKEKELKGRKESLKNKSKSIDSDSESDDSIKQEPLAYDSEAEDNIKEKSKLKSKKNEKLRNKSKQTDSDSESGDNVIRKTKNRSKSTDSKTENNYKAKSQPKSKRNEEQLKNKSKLIDSDLESHDTIVRKTKNKSKSTEYDSEAEDSFTEKSKKKSKVNKEKLKSKSNLTDSDSESEGTIIRKTKNISKFADYDSESENDMKEPLKQKSETNVDQLKNKNKVIDSDSELKDTIKEESQDKTNDKSKNISENELNLNDTLKRKNKPKPLRFKLRDLEKEKALNKKLEEDKVKEEVASDSDRVTEQHVNTHQSPQRKNRPKPLRFKLRDEQKKLMSQKASNSKIKEEKDFDIEDSTSKSKTLHQYDSSPLISSDSELEECKLSLNKKNKKRKEHIKRKKDKEVKNKTKNDQKNDEDDDDDKKKKTGDKSGEDENGETDVATSQKISSGTKTHTDSEHISEFETPPATGQESDHNNIEEHQSDQEIADETNKEDLENANKENTSTVKVEIPKMNKKTLLLKIIDEFYKKKKTQRKKNSKSSEFENQDDSNLSSGNNDNAVKHNEMSEETHSDEVIRKEAGVTNKISNHTEEDECLKETQVKINEDMLLETQIDHTVATETLQEAQVCDENLIETQIDHTEETETLQEAQIDDENLMETQIDPSKEADTFQDTTIDEEILIETQIDESDSIKINDNVEKESESLYLNDLNLIDAPLLSPDIEQSNSNEHVNEIFKESTEIKESGTEKNVDTTVKHTATLVENNDCENQNVDEVKSKSNDCDGEPLESNNTDNNFEANSSQVNSELASENISFELLNPNNSDAPNIAQSDAILEENDKNAKDNSTENLDNTAVENNDKAFNEDSENDFESDSDVEIFLPVSEHSYIKKSKKKHGKIIQCEGEKSQESNTCSENENHSVMEDHMYSSSTTETETAVSTLEKAKNISDLYAEPEDEPFKGFSFEETSSLETNAIDMEVISNTHIELGAEITLINSTVKDLCEEDNTSGQELPVSIEAIVADTEESEITENTADSGSGVDTEDVLLESAKKEKVKRLSSIEESSENSEDIQKSPRKTRKISRSDKDFDKSTQNIVETCEENKENKNQESLPCSSASTEEYSLNSRDALFMESNLEGLESREKDTENNGTRKRKLSVISNISNTDLDEISSKNAKLDESVENKEVSEQIGDIVGELKDNSDLQEASKDASSNEKVQISKDIDNQTTDKPAEKDSNNDSEEVNKDSSDYIQMGADRDLQEANKDADNLQAITESSKKVQLTVDCDLQITKDADKTAEINDNSESEKATDNADNLQTITDSSEVQMTVDSDEQITKNTDKTAEANLDGDSQDANRDIDNLEVIIDSNKDVQTSVNNDQQLNKEANKDADNLQVITDSNDDVQMSVDSDQQVTKDVNIDLQPANKDTDNTQAIPDNINPETEMTVDDQQATESNEILAENKEEEYINPETQITVEDQQASETNEILVENEEEELANNDDSFKLDDKERDELLELLDEHWKTIKNVGEDIVESKKTADKENVLDKNTDLGEDNNRDLLLELLQEYEDCIIAGKAFTAEEKAHEEGQQNDSDGLEREGSKTPEPLLEVKKEVEYIESTPGKKWRRSTEQRQAAEIFKKLMADDSDLESSSSISIESSPCKSLDSDHSDFEVNRTKTSSKFKVTQEILDRHGIDKELVVKIEPSDFGDIDLKDLPKSAKEAVNIERLCDLTSVLQQRKHTNSDTETPKKSRVRKKKRNLASKSRSVSPFSDDESEGGSRPHSRTGSRSPSMDIQSDDSQEAMARAFMDRMKGDSSDDNSLLMSSGEDSSSETDLKKKKKKKISLATTLGSGSEASSDEGKEKSGDEEKKGDKSKEDEEKKKKPPKVLTAEEKRKKRWKRDPLLHGHMLSSGQSSSDSDSDRASVKSDSSEKRRKQMDRLKSKYDVTTPEKDVKKTDQDKSDSDSDRIMKEIAARHNIKKERNNRESDSDTSSIEFVSTKMKTPLKVKRKKGSSDTETDDEVEVIESPSKGKGRRNIRELLSDEALAQDTKKANEEEKKRMKRLEEKKSQRETFSQSQSFGSQDSEEDALVLDIDKKTLEPLIKVHPRITRKLKPHQRDGIQFMWDSCYESCDQLKKGWKGSGCILAHCMGLGKTLQVLALIHTIFKYDDITKTKHVLVVCPLSTVSNWRNEYKLAYKKIMDCDINIFTIEDRKTKENKFIIIKRWKRRGGILIMGYEAFGNLTNDAKLDKWQKQNQCNKEEVLEALVKPGPDLVVCDEGHLLKNKKTIRNISLNKVSTRRRIVLTGTPLQNNLIEYYCMVNFVKPNLLGNEKEYKTQFVNPITNGQYEDSTPGDIKLMKYRTHVLHRVLKGTVQRVEDTELKKYLPKLVDYALFVQISDMQIDFYNKYMDLASDQLEYNKEGNVCQKNFLADVVMVKYICSHPYLLSVVDKKAKNKIKEQDVIDDSDDEHMPSTVVTNRWWRNMLPDDSHERMEFGSKIMLAIKIVEEAEALDEKVLIFSNYHGEMDVLEHFLSLKGTKACPSWKKRQDYYRMDGTIVPEERAFMCQKFNDPNNTRLRVFIISTKVGGLGLNLTAATRIVIMTVNWNPSYDTQSVFRAYRFGQTKPVFVYRLISMSTLEEKIYQRSVTKLAVASRVVDKHQIKRAFTRADIEEMYNLRPTKDAERPLPNYPEDDKLLAKLIQKHKCVFRWHEHQGLLANRPEEELSAQEKEAAWQEFNQRQEAPPPNMQPFGGNLMPNMGAMAAMHLINAYGGNMNNVELMNMLKSYNNVPKMAGDHDYSLPTNTNSTMTTPNNLQPRNIFNNNQPPNLNQPPVTVPSTSAQDKNFAAFLQEIKNSHVRGMVINSLNNVRLPAATAVSSSNIPKFQPASNLLTNTTKTVTKNWLTNQLSHVGPDRCLRFSLKNNEANEAGVKELSWPGSKVQKTQAGIIYFSYLPPNIKYERNLQFESHSVKAPDGSDIQIYTAAVPTSGPVVKRGRNSHLINVNNGFSGIPNKAQTPITLPSGTQMTPTTMKPVSSGTSSTTTSGALATNQNNFVRGHVIKETSTGREIVPVRALSSSLYDPPSLNMPPMAVRNAAGPPVPLTPTPAAPSTLKPGQKPPPLVQIKETSATQDSTKRVVPNPFANSHRSNSVPIIRRIPEPVKNNVKKAGTTGTKQVVPNPVNNHMRLSQTQSPKPPPAHTGRAVGSPTVAKPPKVVSNRSIENLTPGSQVVDLSGSKTATNPTQPKRAQNLLRSPPNQNINANVRGAASNSPGLITNSPKTAAVNSPNTRSSTNKGLSSSAKPGTSGVFVTSREISNQSRGTKRAYDGGGSLSTGVNKKLLLLQDQRKSAMPPLTPRPPTVGTAIKASPQDIYKQMLKNVDYKGLMSTNKNKLQTNTPVGSLTQPAATSNKENRRNRLQLNQQPSSSLSNLEDDDLIVVEGTPVNNRTLEKLKKDGVSISKVDKKDSGVIHLD